MARVSIYVSDELKAEMDKAGDAINWSQIARPAFMAALMAQPHHGSIRFKRQTFLPTEAAGITGASIERQHELQRLGYLEKSRVAWAEFDVFDLAEILLLQELAKRAPNIVLPPSMARTA